MNMKECKRRSSGRIPAFGNWECANDLPITQYFESARQAGLIRHSNSSYGECDNDNDLYMVSDFNNEYPSPPFVLPIKTTTRRVREKRNRHVKEQRKQQNDARNSNHNHVIVYEVTEPSKITSTGSSIQNELLFLRKYHDTGPARKLPPVITVVRAPKPVDEDLYKISPDLLLVSKRKKMFGFFPRCLLPSCVI